jgi:site-specific recombinase XerD
MESQLACLARLYVRERHARGEFSAESARAIRYTLLDFCHHIGGVRPELLRRRHVEEWLAAGAYSPASIRARLSRLRMFCHWLVERDVIEHDPTAGMRGPRRQRRLPRGLPTGDVELTLGATPDHRGRLVVLLMVQEGLRCGETARLEINDIRFDERLMLVRGKGGHERVLPISDETWDALLDYLEETGIRAGPVLRSKVRPDRGISPKHVSDLVRGWMGSAHVAATAHALRHTCAGDLLRSGVHLRDVQHILGHASLATTELYLPWVVGDLRTAMAGRRYGRAPAR